MTIIILLISISIIIAAGFLVSFLWNLKSGQYDDTYSPSVRMLTDGSIKHEVGHSNKGSNKKADNGNTDKSHKSY